MSRNLERYFAVGLGMLCMLKGYTVGLVFIILIELLFTRKAASQSKK